MARKGLGAAPVNDDDVVDKRYADHATTKPAGFTAPSGSWQNPSNVISGVAGTPVAGVVYWHPIDIGPADMTLQSLGVHCSVAVAGTGTYTFSIGLYSDDGSGGGPLLTAGGRLVNGTVTAAATGRKTLATSVVLTPGRYWSAFIYVVTSGAAPTTLSQWVVSTNGATTLWITDGTTFGTNTRFLQATGQTALPTSSVTVTSGGSSVAPIVLVRRA